MCGRYVILENIRTEEEIHELNSIWEIFFVNLELHEVHQLEC